MFCEKLLNSFLPDFPVVMDCDALKDNGLHSTWSLVGGTLVEELEGVTLLKGCVIGSKH